jgi:hypothetical protein
VYQLPDYNFSPTSELSNMALLPHLSIVRLFGPTYYALTRRTAAGAYDANPKSFTFRS